MPNVGPLELAVVLVIALLVLGPKRLPEVGRSLGKGMREFKDSLSGHHDDDDDELDVAGIEQPPKPLATAAAAAPASPADTPQKRPDPDSES
jgi:sec-independent protein translocase protein TatA